MLANLLAEREQQIPRGTFVMTGGITEAVAASAGDSFVARYEHLGFAVGELHLTVAQDAPHMPIAHVLIMEGREPEQKKALIRSVTAAIADSLQARPDSVRVIVQEVPKEHWGIGGVSALELGR